MEKRQKRSNSLISIIAFGLIDDHDDKKLNNNKKNKIKLTADTLTIKYLGEMFFYTILKL